MKIDQFIIVKGKKRSTYSSIRSYTSRMTKTKPSLEHDEVAVKVELDIPDALFEKPSLEAKIVIPKEAVSAPVISAEVLDNIEDIILQTTGFEVKLAIINPEAK